TDEFSLVSLLQITWIEEIVLNRVTRTNNVCVLEAFH
ncbi:hypothetical protein D030_4894B, partial [Vibrio parahaemolyticus AQ3810]